MRGIFLRLGGIFYILERDFCVIQPGSTGDKMATRRKLDFKGNVINNTTMLEMLLDSDYECDGSDKELDYQPTENGSDDSSINEQNEVKNVNNLKFIFACK